MILCKYCKIKKTENDFYPSDLKGRRCKNCRKISTNKWNQKNPEQMRVLQRRFQYGIEETEYQTLCVSQQNSCAICRKEVITLCVDHDHKTKSVRGLLCKNCNIGLGHMQDSVEILESAINYLRKMQQL